MAANISGDDALPGCPFSDNGDLLATLGIGGEEDDCETDDCDVLDVEVGAAAAELPLSLQHLSRHYVTILQFSSVYNSETQFVESFPGVLVSIEIAKGPQEPHEPQEPQQRQQHQESETEEQAQPLQDMKS